MKFYYRTTFPTLHVQTEELADLPLPKQLTDTQEQAITSIVDRILAAKRDNPAADISTLETKLDALIYTLYNLTPSEIKIVEGEV